MRLVNGLKAWTKALVSATTAGKDVDLGMDTDTPVADKLGVPKLKVD